MLETVKKVDPLTRNRQIANTTLRDLRYLAIEIGKLFGYSKKIEPFGNWIKIRINHCGTTTKLWEIAGTTGKWNDNWVKARKILGICDLLEADFNGSNWCWQQSSVREKPNPLAISTWKEVITVKNDSFEFILGRPGLEWFSGMVW